MARKAKVAVPARPVPVRTEQRICFGIQWYATEAEAKVAADLVRAEGRTYNGGFFHGMACGRDTTWDYTTPDGQRLYAVTY